METANAKLLRGFLRTWNMEVFGYVDTEIETANAKLLQIQIELSREGFEENLHRQELEVRCRLEFLILSKHKLMTDSCRVKWLKDGDRNSAFFHALQRRHRSAAGISALWVNGELTDNMTDIEHHILSFYEELFQSDGTSGNLEVVPKVIPKMFTDMDNINILHMSFVSDIKNVVFSMDQNSAPWPDGFTGLFFKVCWDFLGIDVVRTVQYMFHTSSSSFPGEINSFFMVLLPKTDSTDSIEHFRPIALGNFVFKIVTKLLADRLSSVVAWIISPSQFGFVQGRHIESCVTGVSECINLMDRKVTGGSMAVKVDVRKRLIH